MPAKSSSKKPNDSLAGGAAQPGANVGPDRMPPSSSGRAAMQLGTARPEDLTAEQRAMASSGYASGQKPTALPPQTAESAGGVKAWQNGKRVTALWSINQNRNSWVYIDGVGWKQLVNNSDSVIVALTILGAHARQSQTNVDYREEADGMIHEMYVW